MSLPHYSTLTRGSKSIGPWHYLFSSMNLLRTFDAGGGGESPASQLLAQIGHDGWAQLKHWLSTVQLPPKVPAQLRVQANGITGRTGFSIKAEWEGHSEAHRAVRV